MKIRHTPLGQMAPEKRSRLLYGGLLAAAAAAMLLYWRITLNAQIYGDDCITTLQNYYYVSHTPVWQLQADALQNIWNVLTLRGSRFFHFSFFPDWLRYYFQGSVVSYRCYILWLTLLDTALLSTLLWRLTGSRWQALAAFALQPLMLCLWTDPSLNAMYSYEGWPQSTLLYMLLTAHCMIFWARSRRWYWAVLVALAMFSCCSMYEIGFPLLVVIGFLALLLHERFWDAVCTGLPALGGELVAFFYYTAGSWGNSGLKSYDGLRPTFDWQVVVRTTLQQASGGFPLNQLWEADVPFPANWSLDDALWPLVLALVCAFALWHSRPQLRAKQYICLFLAGFFLLMGPAALIGVSKKYQDLDWVSWKSAYIPAAVESFGVGLMALVLLLAAFQAAERLRGRAPWLKPLLAGALVLALTLSGVYQRADTRAHHPPTERQNYELLANGAAAGVAAAAGPQDTLLCDFNVWGDSADAQALFFRRYGEQEVQAWPVSAWPADLQAADGTLYRMGRYADYGGYGVAWCGRMEPDRLDTLADVRVFVDGSRIPDTAVLKYYHREADGSETLREIPLADLPQTARDSKNRYCVDITGDDAVAIPKIMIWDG